MALGKVRAAGRDGDMRQARIFWLSWKTLLSCAAMQRSLSAPKWCQYAEESLLQPPLLAALAPISLLAALAPHAQFC